MIALAAKAYGARVLILAETDKHADDPETKETMEEILHQRVDSLTAAESSQEDTLLRIPVDCLTTDAYDEVIYGDAAAMRAEQA